jgi:hypothetical protein
LCISHGRIVAPRLRVRINSSYCILYAKAVRASRRNKLGAEMRERITTYDRDLAKKILRREFLIKRLTVYNNNHVLDRRREVFLCLSFPVAGFEGRG